MITDAHFETLRQVREEAANLRLVCTNVEGAGAMLHIAYDGEVSQRTSPKEKALLRKLRAVK